MRFLRVVYVVAIAVVLVLVVIFGVEAFYPAPPAHPSPLHPSYYTTAPSAYNSSEYEEWEQERREAWEEYQQEVAARDKNIFSIVLPLGAVFAIGGTFIRRRLDIFGAGLILGGMGTMIFAIVSHDLDNILRFVGIAVALAVLVFLGYKVFLSLRKS